MTNEIDKLRDKLASSPGWQQIAQATETQMTTGEAKVTTKTDTQQAEYFVEYCSYWQNARDHFAGPFATAEEAEAAVADLEVTLDCTFVSPDRNARNITRDKRYRIVPATGVDMRDFVAYAHPDHDNETPLLDIYKIQNKKMRRFLGLSPTLGRPATIEAGENVTFRLGADSREHIAVIRAANLDMASDTDAVRAALKWYAETKKAK